MGVPQVSSTTLLQTHLFDGPGTWMYLVLVCITEAWTKTPAASKFTPQNTELISDFLPSAAIASLVWTRSSNVILETCVQFSASTAELEGT